MNHDSMNTDDVLGMTDAYAHGLLDESQKRRVEELAASNQVWRAALDEARSRARALDTLPTIEPSEALLQRAFQAAQSKDRSASLTRRVFQRYIPLAFAAAVAMLVGLDLYFSNVKPGGYDLTILGQSALASGSPGSMRVRLLDGAGGNPVKGATVTVSLRSNAGEEAKLAQFETDALGTGSPRYQVPDWKEGQYELRVTAAGRETLSRTVTLQRSSRLMLSTDKPVYQPGQTIHMRSLALLRSAGVPVTGQEVLFKLADPKGTLIFKQRTVTSAFGISSTDCPLADQIIEGPYTLTCEVAGTVSTRTVEVKHYALPKFRVGMDVSEPYLRPGQLVRAKVSASYFFGQSVAGGRADVEIKAPDSGFVLQEHATLDTNGDATIQFRVPERLVGTEARSGDAKLVITATVRDTGGQSESRSITRPVSSAELRLEILPESGTLIPGIPNRMYALVSTPDGRPAARARVSIAGLPTELVTSELGVTSFELTPAAETMSKPNADRGTARGATIFVVSASATDIAGRHVSRTINLSTREIHSDFLMSCDAATYAAGETLKLQFIGGGSEPVFVDLLKDGQTVLTQVTDFKQGRATLAIDLPQDLTGTMEIAAYRFNSRGFAVQRSRSVVVEGSRELIVKVTPDKQQYKPGDRAHLSIAVTDETGKSGPAAVSIAGVDESVFSVLDQAPGVEKTLTTLDERLLTPVYTLYPWAATLRGTETQKEFDRALFSSTAIEKPSNRQEIFRQLVKDGMISEEMLDVLDSPRADRMIADMEKHGSLSAEVAQLLRGKGGGAAAHTLSGSTWPEKVVKAEHLRASGHSFVQGGWVLAGVLLVLVLIAAIFIFVSPTLGQVIVAVGALVLVVAIILPSLGKARAASRQLREQAELRGLAQAVELSDLKFGAPAAYGGTAPSRIREWFPETLVWAPEIITDESGRASLDVDLADSITTWRLTGGAITRDGRLGSLASQLTVFQPFFVDINAPISLTRGDEISIPIVVYNYLDTPQNVQLQVSPEPWFGLMESPNRLLMVPAKGVFSTSVRIHVLQAGSHQFQVSAAASNTDVADTIRRAIEVLPGGVPIDSLVSGSLKEPLAANIDVPSDMIENSGVLLAKLYASPLSQFVEGLDGIFQAPHGCFEQTSSTTYPNVLALEYLKRAGKSVPAVEAKARGYIHTGYQRLLTFEVPGGGFDWFGRPPGNRLLTAYGLMEFMDMAKVHDVDPALIDRTRAWLLSQRRSDGSWANEHHGLESGMISQRGTDADLASTAYIAWAVFGTGNAADAGPTRGFLESRGAEKQDDAYTVALLAHAIGSMGGNPNPWLDRLKQLSQRSSDGSMVWWTAPAGMSTHFYGTGHYADIETSALAVLALLQQRGDVTLARRSLTWLISQRDSRGTWGTTQATVLALKALVVASEAPLGEPVQREFTVELDGKPVRQVSIAPDQAEVLTLIDLSKELKPGTHRVVVRQTKGPAAQAQITFHGAIPGDVLPQDGGNSPLNLSVTYDRNSLRVGDELHASAQLVCLTPAPIAMVMLDLPIPPGFEPHKSEFDALVVAGDIARYEVTPRTVIVYLTSVDPNRPLVLRYSMRATMPVEAQGDRPRAYEYYNPARKVHGSPERFVVQPLKN